MYILSTTSITFNKKPFINIKLIVKSEVLGEFLKIKLNVLHIYI